MAIRRSLTIKEAAAALRMSQNGVMNLIARGQLPGVRLPGGGFRRPVRLFIDEEDVNEYIERWKKQDEKSVTVSVNV